MKETMERQMDILLKEMLRLEIKTLLKKETEKRRRVLQENRDLRDQSETQSKKPNFFFA